MQITKTGRLLASVVLTINLVACASGAPPKAELELSQQAIKGAAAVGAGELAQQEMALAEQKLADAQGLIEKKKYERAQRLLQQVIVDAELAANAAEASKLQTERARLQQSVDQVQQQLSAAED